jgi:hypothetical protein
MIKQELELTNLEKRVYNRFCRAFVNLPVYFGREVILLDKEEAEVKQAIDDSRAMCEEMEEGDEIILYDDQIRMLAMLAAADVTEQVSPALLHTGHDGRNFND